MVLARPITLVLTPGFANEPEKLDLTVNLMRIMFPGIGLLVLSAWCLAVLNSHRKFFLSYVAPVLWNTAQIVVGRRRRHRGQHRGIAWPPPWRGAS